MLELKENGQLGRLLDFSESKVGSYAIRAHERNKLTGLLEFALSPAGKMAREMDREKLLEILEQNRREIK